MSVEGVSGIHQVMLRGGPASMLCARLQQYMYCKSVRVCQCSYGLDLCLFRYAGTVLSTNFGTIYSRDQHSSSSSSSCSKIDGKHHCTVTRCNMRANVFQSVLIAALHQLLFIHTWVKPSRSRRNFSDWTTALIAAGSAQTGSPHPRC